MKQLLLTLFLSTAAFAQGTVILGPVSVVTLSPTQQSGIIMTDINLPLPPPTNGQYILSISNGQLVESDNAGQYHSLVGPQGIQGPVGPVGPMGLTGPPGVIVGSTVTASGSMTCAPARGYSVPSGFTCTFTNLTFKINSIH
jgi:hypothetical protein